MPDIAALVETATNASEGSFRRRMAVSELARSGQPEAVEALIHLLGDEDVYLRREVVSALAKTEDRAVIEPLIGVLDVDDDYLQRDAAEGLGRFGDRRALEPLKRLLDDNAYSVRSAAKRSIEQIEQRIPPSEHAPEPRSPIETEPAGSEPRPAITPTPIPPPRPADQPADGAPITAELVAEPATRPAVPGVPAVSPAPVSPALVSPAPVAPAPVSPAPVSSASVSSASVSPAPVAPAAVSSAPVSPTTVSPAPVSAAPVPAPVISTPSAVSPPAVATNEPAGLATPRLPRSISDRLWERATRFRTLFDDVAPQLRERYANLAKAEAALLESEQQYGRILEQLGQEELTNRDALARVEREVDSASKSLSELQREANRNQRRLQQLNRDAASLAFQLGSFLSADRGRRHRAARANLDAETTRLSTAIDQARQQLASRQQQYDELAAPLKQLQQQAEELAALRVSGYQAIGNANQAVNAWISAYLLRLPTAELRRRLSDLAERSWVVPVLQSAADELLQAVSELENHAAELSAAESEREQAATAAADSTNALGAAIADGFQRNSIERRTTVRLSGSLEFREQRSTFGGSRGASGTASGTGNGHASYSVDELQWDPPPEFGERLTGFAGAWTRSGQAAARCDWMRSRVDACRRQIDDLARLIRTELEQDLLGGRDE
jgi:hypothetical protein